jgi:hypothetical protein
MYCPICRTEYREGFTKCADCRVALVAEVPPEMPDSGEAQLELVTVLESNNRVELGLAKSLLAEAGIPYSVPAENILRIQTDVSPFTSPWTQIQVGADRADEAREIIAAMQLPAPGDAE